VAKACDSNIVWYGGPVDTGKMVVLHKGSEVGPSKSVGNGLFLSEDNETILYDLYSFLQLYSVC